MPFFVAWACASIAQALLLWACSSGEGTHTGSPSDASADVALEVRSEDAVSEGTNVDADCPAPSTFDPATASEMAYSAVPDQTTSRTHLALSSDHGATWTLAVEANVPEAATIPSTDQTECPGGSCSVASASCVPACRVPDGASRDPRSARAGGARDGHGAGDGRADEGSGIERAG